MTTPPLPMKISVVVPVFNAADDLRQCLSALATSTRLPDEIIVVDDGSSDESIAVAQDAGALVISSGAQARGPAFARNRGVEKANGDIVVFLDADVCVHANALALFEQNFTQQDIAAIFGSYDDAPPAPGLFSGYYNLRHHWTHQHANREAWTFWSGCGVVRRDIFLKLDGFDENYARPCIEDVALGRTLRRAGHRVLLCPDIQATHLKKWTLRSWLRTDIRDRAIPWTQLLLEENDVPADLNLDWKSRASAVTSWLAMFCIAAGFWNAQIWLLATLMLIAQIGLNAPLLAFFASRRGVFFAVGAWMCHLVYFLYSSAIFGGMSIDQKWRKRTVRFRHRVLVLLIAALCKGLLWSVIVPPWHAADEPQHYLFAHEILRQNTTRIVATETVPLDAWQLSRLAPRQRAVAGLPLDFSNRAATAKALQEIDSIKTRRARVVDGGQLMEVKGFITFHPPLYYRILSSVLAPLQDSGIRWQLLTARWFSALLGVLTTALAVAIGLEIWPRRRDWALLLGVLVAFQPMNTFTQAVITDDALLTTLFSALLWCVLRIARTGMTWQRGAAVGLLCAAGLLTKMSFACAMPLLLGLMIWRTTRELKCSKRSFLRERNRSTSAIAGWLLLFTLPAILSGWWYRETLGNSSGRLIQSSFLQKNGGETAPPPVGLGWEGTLRHKVGQMPVVGEIGTYVRVAISYWGNFGWVDVRIPGALWLSLLILTLNAIHSVLRRLWRARSKHEHSFAGLETRRSRRALCWLGVGSVALFAFYTFIDWRTRVTTGGAFGLRGGYYLPAIAAQMAWLMVGTSSRVQGKINVLCIVGIGIVALNFYCLFGVVARRHYGEGSLWHTLQHATILHPLSSALLLLIFTATLVSSTLLLMVLRRFPNERERESLSYSHRAHKSLSAC